MSNPASNPNKAIDDGPALNHVETSRVSSGVAPLNDPSAAGETKYSTHNQHSKADDNPGGAENNYETRKTHSSKNNDVGDATSATSK